MARWNLSCPSCNKYEPDVTCSLFDIPACPDCNAVRTISYDSGSQKTGVFPFETTHIDGKPMVIESLHHLRSIERERGVVFSAFSKANVNDLDPIRDLPKFVEHPRR